MSLTVPPLHSLSATMKIRPRSWSMWIVLAALAGALTPACSNGSLPAGPHTYCLNTPLKMTDPPGDTTCKGIVVTDTPDSGLPARLAELAKVCTDGDGMVMTMCPSAKLLGCCQARSKPDPEETCYYTGSASYWEQACCGGGQCPSPYYWSSTSF